MNLSDFNHIIAAAPCSMAIVDTNMHYLAVSNQWISLYHLEDRELIGKSHYEIFPESAAHWKKLFTRCLQGEDKDGHAEKFVTPNGNTVWINWNIRHWLTEDGSVGGLILTTEDVSFNIERKKKLVENLYQSEMQYNQAFTHSIIGMALISPDGNWEKINKSLSEILGYTEEELVGHHVIEITHKEDIAESHKSIIELSSGHIENKKVQKRYIHKNGSTIWVMIAATMLHDKQGKPLHFVSQIEDITKRKEIEENLVLSEKKYRTIFENVQDVFYQTDNQGLITDISPSIEKYSGFLKTNILNQPVSNFYYYIEDREKILKALQTEGSVVDFEVRLKTKDDKLRYASVNAHLIIEDGAVVGTEGSLRDITTRKFHENALKDLNTELTASNELKNELLSIIGHDLRNPISGSLQLLNLTLMDFQSNTAEELQMYLLQMKQELSNANNLLEDLLSWAKVQFKSVNMDPVSITDITYHIQNAILTIKPMADKKNIPIHVEVEEALTLYADAGMLEAIFRNLLSNAIKFTNNNGRIDIKGWHIDTGVKFSVADNGVGMSKEQMAKLFNKNSNYTTYGTSGEKGTGLGLNLCHDFALKHGGDLWVESEPGVGTTFYFVIPKHNPLLISQR